MNKVRLGVIGTGNFAELCHLPGLQSHPQAEVVALCGRNYERARALANRFSVPDVHTDYLELCRRDDIDAVTIVTPNAFHAEQAVTAFRCGKHVLCEKPLGKNVAEAQAMLGAAAKSGKVHQVAFTFRYGYAIRELRRRIQAGEIGKPFYARIQYDSWDGLRPDWHGGWREKQNLAGGGLLFDVGSHLFDILRFVLGPIESVTGFVHRIPRQYIEQHSGSLAVIETDDLAAAWFSRQDGTRGQWFVSRISPQLTENGYLEVIGPEGALKAGLSRGKADRLKLSTPISPEWREVLLREEAYDGKPHSLGIMMRSFVDACLLGRLDENQDASFQDGLAVQQDLAAVLEGNLYTESSPITLNSINAQA
jgi:predicted dehydrogenase